MKKLFPSRKELGLAVLLLLALGRGGAQAALPAREYTAAVLPLKALFPPLATEKRSLLALAPALQTPAASSLEQRALSPADTLEMSPLEGLLWRRHGLMRLAGLFPLDRNNPINDFRQMARVRRKMLSFHQLLGMATIASMALTVYGGQRAINGHSSHLHKATLPVTIGLYSSSALLALAAPPKLVPSRGGGLDTIGFHKIFAVVHLAGMIITPLIAPGGNSSRAAERRHQISGYATFGAFTAGMLVVSIFR